MKTDRADLIQQIMKEAKSRAMSREAERSKPASRQQPAQPQVSVQPVGILGYSTYFYPPIWVGKISSMSFKEKALGKLTFPRKILDLKYKNKVLVMNEDGLIAIEEKNPTVARRRINEIMATFLLSGFEVNAVFEAELGAAEIHPSSLSITRWGGAKTLSLRTSLNQFFPLKPLAFEGRTEIDKEDIVKIIKQAERITSDPEASDYLVFFLEASTHLKSSEYLQSFIMSWVIIERHLSWLWNKFLKEAEIAKRRREKLTNPAYWTIDFVLEGLNLNGKLSDMEYEDLMSLKNKRNDIIHSGETVNVEEAKKCLEIAKQITKQKSGL